MHDPSVHDRHPDGLLTDRPAGRRSADRLLSRRGLQVTLGLLWLLDAAFQAEPANFARDYPLGDLAQSVMGAPSWENQAVFSGIRPFAAHWPWWNLASLLLQAAIGIGLLRGGRWARPALAVSFVWAATIWLLGEGLGMLPTGFAMMLTGAPGAAFLYVVLGGLAWPRRGVRDVSRRAWAVAWVGLWAGAASLQVPFVYGARQMLSANFAETSDGQRAFLVRIAGEIAQVAAHDPVAFSAGLAVLQLAVAGGWLLDRDHPRRWLVLGIVVSAAYWVVGQSMGEVLSAGATDPGTAPLVVVLALAGWPVSARLGQEGRQRVTGPGQRVPVDPLVGVVGQ